MLLFTRNRLFLVSRGCKSIGRLASPLRLAEA